MIIIPPKSELLKLNKAQLKALLKPAGIKGYGDSDRKSLMEALLFYKYRRERFLKIAAQYKFKK